MSDDANNDQTVSLSVVIPAFNEEAHIDEQLDALAQQQWPGHRFEVLVVDNRSTDRTVEIAEGFADRFDVLRVVPATDRPGLSYARNTGITAAHCDQIAICDADDIVADGWVAAIGDALQEHRLVSGVLEVNRLNPRGLPKVEAGQTRARRQSSKACSVWRRAGTSVSTDRCGRRSVVSPSGPMVQKTSTSRCTHGDSAMR